MLEFFFKKMLSLWRGFDLFCMKKVNLRRAVRRGILRPLGTMVFQWFPDLAAAYRMREEKADFRREAEKFFEQGDVKLPEGASREGYFEALDKYAISLSEYLYQYDFYKLNDQERDEFISRAQMRALAYKLRMKYPEESMGLPRFKEQYMGRFTELGFIHRRWLYVPECTYQQFIDLLSSVDCIIKPADGSLGIGVEIIDRQDDSEQTKELYEKCVRGKMLLEECVKGCKELQAFHPQSLNSIRFVTMAFRGRALPFGAIFRMGIGDMIIDNVHAGGFCTQIDMETGVVESNGLTVSGMLVTEHPDSGLTIKGTQIPHWNEICEFCLSAARQTKNIITGWDIVVTDKGQIELIEVNNRPDFDGGMQAPLKRGVKRKVLEMLKDLIGEEFTV